MTTKTRSARKAKAPALPASHLQMADRLGFEIMSYRNVAIAVRDAKGEERREWLPADMINWEKRQYIRFCRADEGNYDFDGYEPTDGQHFGGRYDSPLYAFGWFEWLEEQNSGIRNMPAPSHQSNTASA